MAPEEREAFANELNHLPSGLMSMRVPMAEREEPVNPELSINLKIKDLVNEWQFSGTDKFRKLKAIDEACDLILDLVNNGKMELAINWSESLADKK